MQAWPAKASLERVSTARSVSDWSTRAFDASHFVSSVAIKQAIKRDSFAQGGEACFLAKPKSSFCLIRC